MSIFHANLIVLSLSTAGASGDCDFSVEALNRYEDEILRAADTRELNKMAAPLACMLQMQSESEGLARYMSSSFLRPLLGGHQTPGLKKDQRYLAVSRVLEQLALKSNDVARGSFVDEFSRGDWKFYTLFCEQGNTDHCAVFLPDEGKVNAEAPLLAAASMLRLKKAYQVLHGDQRDLVARRIKNLYRQIPKTARLKRKFIEQIYNELFPESLPISMLG